MPIPSYKQVHIKSEKKEMIFDQLSIHQFGQVPYILSIDHLTAQDLAIVAIEEYFELNKVSNYPYPIYIVSTVKNYLGPLQIKNAIEDCPKFYKQKIKQLNNKENKILQKIYLKQKNLQNIRLEDYLPFLNEYAKSHKRLNELYKEQVFYEELIEKLEKYYEQKDN